MNLIGFMLSKQSWQDEPLMNKLLQTMLLNYQGVNLSYDRQQEENKFEDDEDSEKMLVFKDLHGKLWQITQVDEDMA